MKKVKRALKTVGKKHCIRWVDPSVAVKSGRKAVESDLNGFIWLAGRAKEVAIIIDKAEQLHRGDGVGEATKVDGLISAACRHVTGLGCMRLKVIPFPSHGSGVDSSISSDFQTECRTMYGYLCKSHFFSSRCTTWGWEEGVASHSFWKTHEQASEVVMELEEEERLNNGERWHDWADNAVEGGATFAHAATKEAKQAAVPGASCEVSMTGCPAEILISEVASYAELWGADPSGRKLKNVEDAAMKELDDILSNTDPPKKLTGKGLRNAAKTFKICTTRPDAIHPRHIAYLSDSAVEAPADLLNLVEVTGELPDEMCDVVVALFDKPEGGTRPVGWYRAIVRVWASARKHLWQEWERSSGEKSIFGAGEGRTITDIVW